MGNRSGTVDVLVIGAGASGAAFAWSLSEAGIDVMCLEQGDWVKAEDYPTNRESWEVHRQTDFHYDPNVRGLPQDYPLNNDESAISPLMFNAVGGSTIHWGAHFPRLHPSDFRVKSLDGVADDWPLSYEELEPFFDLNDRMMGVTGLGSDPAYPPRPERPTPPLPLGKQGNTLVRGFEKLGWHWWPAEGGIVSVSYDGRQGCVNAGPCDVGCPIGAKSTADITYWPKALANGATLKTHARVREIIVGADGLAQGAIYYDERGRVQEQRARMVVLACNGVGTPRLLLNSTSALFPDGLANSSGLVGKNLMLHPIAFVVGVFDEDLEADRGAVACSITSHEFYETDLSRGFVRGFQMQGNHEGGPVHTSLGGPLARHIPWGKDHHRVFAERYGRTGVMAVLTEDLPEEHNQVVLDPTLADDDGIPAPRIRYTVAENCEKILAYGADRAGDLMRAAGATQVRVASVPKSTGWHLLGTARMGTDPENSVVDQWGRCHDVKNLLIVDGSNWVTAGAVNPTSTIQAIALYMADHVKSNGRHQLN